MKKLLSIVVIEYFRLLAKIQLKKNPAALIIGVTGSAGKTSTRLAIAHLLSSRGRVKHSHHANSETGIPLNILGLRTRDFSLLDWARLIILAPIKLLTNWEKFDYYVVEMGIDSPDSPKNMDYLLKIISPQVGVVLNTGIVHAESFDKLVKDTSPERRYKKLRGLIAQEKMKLAQSLPTKGIAIINIDQIELKGPSSRLKSRTITIGKSKSASFRILSSKVTKKGTEFSFLYQGATLRLVLPDIFAPHFGYTFAAAMAVLAGLGYPPGICINNLETYRSPAGRMRIFSGINNSLIIDSSYNASPDSMEEALSLLKTLGSHSKRIAVIGDMRELGTSAKLAHKKLVNWITTNSTEAILFGPLTKEHTFPVLKSAKFPVHHFSKMSELTTHLRSRLTSKSTVLVKGSQNTILLERAVEAVLANPVDIVNLCRRGKYWDRVRAKTV